MVGAAFVSEMCNGVLGALGTGDQETGSTLLAVALPELREMIWPIGRIDGKEFPAHRPAGKSSL
jgi:hypothetical protein